MQFSYPLLITLSLSLSFSAICMVLSLTFALPIFGWLVVHQNLWLSLIITLVICNRQKVSNSSDISRLKEKRAKGQTQLLLPHNGCFVLIVFTNNFLGAIHSFVCLFILTWFWFWWILSRYTQYLYYIWSFSTRELYRSFELCSHYHQIGGAQWVYS